MPTNPHEPIVRKAIAPAVLRSKPSSLYLGIPEGQFLKGVAAGRFPQPLKPTGPRGPEVWLIRELDALVERLAAERDQRLAKEKDSNAA